MSEYNIVMYNIQRQTCIINYWKYNINWHKIMSVFTAACLSWLCCLVNCTHEYCNCIQRQRKRKYIWLYNIKYRIYQYIIHVFYVWCLYLSVSFISKTERWKENMGSHLRTWWVSLSVFMGRINVSTSSDDPLLNVVQVYKYNVIVYYCWLLLLILSVLFSLL